MYKRYVKRLFDIIFASILLIISLPIALILSLLIKLESPGPILFTQQRTGHNGRMFKLKKFRSMSHNNNVRDLSKKNEITKVGKILRTTSLDEIPQLINVLKGDMSFIGPRPWIPEYFKHMTPRQRKRTAVLPGITGLAQVYGRNSLTINQKINYDLEYVNKISFKEDLKIALLTIKVIFDKGSQEIEKLGIQNELEVLRVQKQEADAFDSESGL